MEWRNINETNNKYSDAKYRTNEFMNSTLKNPDCWQFCLKIRLFCRTNGNRDFAMFKSWNSIIKLIWQIALYRNTTKNWMKKNKRQISYERIHEFHTEKSRLLSVLLKIKLFCRSNGNRDFAMYYQVDLTNCAAQKYNIKQKNWMNTLSS